MAETEDNKMVYGEKVILHEGLSKTTKALIDFNKIPQEIKQEFWEVFNNNLTLAFITNRQDENIIRRQFRILLIDYLSTLNPEDYTWELEKTLNKIMFEFEKQVLRAKGTSRRIWNERSLIAMQISEGISTTVNNPQKPKGILGLFNKG